MKKKIYLLSTLFMYVISYSQNIENPKQRFSDLILEDEIIKYDNIIKNYNDLQNNLEYEAFSKNIPLNFKDEFGNTHVLFYFDNNNPIYKSVDNYGSAITSRVNLINSGGSLGLDLNGQGMTIGVWDGGPIRTTHNSLLNRVVIGDNQYFTTSDEDNVHATHVAGTIAASNIDMLTKGLAYQSTIKGYTFAQDIPEVLSFAQSGGLVSNHSYGTRIESLDEKFRGAYISESRTWDDITNLYPFYLPVISAGNDRGKSADNTFGIDLLIGNKNSKNVVVVAAVGQVLSYQNPSSVVMSSFSSWGPTDDYRIKPDISAKGVAVTSLSSSADDGKTTLQGTSMAAPAVSATLALLQQHHNNRFGNWMRSSMLKAVMINSADEAGSFPGPDFKFGWGLINGAAGVNLISNKNQSSILEDVSLNNNEIYERIIISNGQKLKATITWNDPAATPNTTLSLNDRTSKLINDLDLRLEKEGEIFYPWVLNINNLSFGSIKQDNPYDNVEQVEIDLPEGKYKIKVSHKNNLESPQIFSLVVSNATFENLSQNDLLKDTVKIFPNPSNGILNIFSNSLNIDFVNVFDVQGRLVFTKKIVENNSDIILDLSFLSKGVYNINLISDKKSYNQHIFIK